MITMFSKLSLLSFDFTGRLTLMTWTEFTKWTFELNSCKIPFRINMFKCDILKFFGTIFLMFFEKQLVLLPFLDVLYYLIYIILWYWFILYLCFILLDLQKERPGIIAVIYVIKPKSMEKSRQLKKQLGLKAKKPSLGDALFKVS